jgi:hypothetical protein
MKRCPFQLGTGWRQTGAAPTLLPLGVDNTVVDFYRLHPAGADFLFPIHLQ